MRFSLILLAVICSMVCLAQLDTVFYDDFSAAKTPLHFAARKDGFVKVENGFVHQFGEQKKKLRFASKLYWTVHFKTPLTNPDTFVYEMRVLANTDVIHGPVFEVYGKKLPVSFYGFLVGEKWVSLTHYWLGNNTRIYRHLNKAAPELKDMENDFRICYGKKKFYVYCNNTLYHTFEINPKKTDFSQFGWMLLRGGDIRVDYVLLRGGMRIQP